MRPLYFCGDIHGEFCKLVYTALTERKISGADILVLGDFGVGFDKKIYKDYERMHGRLESKDVCIYAIRGNHDDPDYFNGARATSFPRLRFLEDHKVVDIGERTIYPVGGANSTDIEWRKTEERQTGKKFWFQGEGPIKKVSDLPAYVDVVVSHAAPLAFLPTPCRYEETTPEQYENILDERRYLDTVLHEVRCQYWFYGHYHNHYADTYGETMSYGLGIMELYECPEIKQLNPQGEE